MLEYLLSLSVLGSGVVLASHLWTNHRSVLRSVLKFGPIRGQYSIQYSPPTWSSAAPRHPLGLGRGYVQSRSRPGHCHCLYLSLYIVLFLMIEGCQELNQQEFSRLTTTIAWHQVNMCYFSILISLHCIISGPYVIPKWNNRILKNWKNNFFPRVPPLKNFENCENCLFSMHFQNML